MKPSKKHRAIARFCLGVLVFPLFQGAVLIQPRQLDSATLSSASATLTNSRLSFKASVADTTSTGATTIAIDNESADDNINHLFPGDTVCFADAGENGCIGDRSYTIGSVIGGDGGTSFTITEALENDLADTDYVIASASGNLAIQFTTIADIPSGGDVYVTIPAVDTTGKTNDGFPDTYATLAGNGFDISTLASADVSMTNCTFDTTETINEGDASNNHRITAAATAACPAGTTLTMNLANNKIINPAPYGSHTQGTADAYKITIATRDGDDNTIDNTEVAVATIEAVLVSATIELSLSFDVDAVGVGATACGKPASIASTVYSIPWGTISAPNTFYDAAHELTVSTNANSGYVVTIEEDDQMNKDWAASPADPCDSPTDSTANYTDGCIADTLCDGGSCSESSEDDWESATSNGFGYSMDNIAGTDATFEYNVATGNCEGTDETDFCARQIADIQASETRTNIMASTAPVSGSNAYTCYRLSISGLQPAGYYINKVKYRATPTF